jgi:hypothetical protein
VLFLKDEEKLKQIEVHNNAHIGTNAREIPTNPSEGITGFWLIVRGLIHKRLESHSNIEFDEVMY